MKSNLGYHGAPMLCAPPRIRRILDVLVSFVYICVYITCVVLIPGLIIILSSTILSTMTRIPIALWLIAFACFLESPYKCVYEHVENCLYHFMTSCGRLCC